MDNRTSKKNFLASLILAALAGGIGISGELIAFPFVLLLAAAFSFAQTWYQSTLTALIYYLFASYGLYPGAYAFTSGSIITMLVAPTIAFIILAIPFAIVAKFRLIGFAIALLIVSLPPVGNFGWANPLTAAGLFFPGTGFIGIGLFAVLLGATFKCPQIAFIAPFVTLFWFIYTPSLPQSENWKPQNTHLGSLLEAGFNPEKDFLTSKKMFPIINKNTDPKILLPEGVFGVWSNAAQSLWENSIDLSNRGIIGGGETRTGDRRYYNSLIVIDNHKPTPVYHSRIPIPYFMTRNSDGYFKAADNNGTFTYQGILYGGLVCYEGYLLWPVLETHLSSPQEVFLVGNYWWAKNTNLVSIVKANASAWSLLFSTPYTVAYNQ